MPNHRVLLACVATALACFAPSALRADVLEPFAGGGTAAEGVLALGAKLIDPFGIDFDRDGNAWIVELTGERLLKVDPKGVISIAAGSGKKGSGGDGGPGREAAFNGMHSLAVHAATGDVYLADTWNNRIRKYEPKTGNVVAFAGTGKKAYSGDGGPASKAEFSGVFCICFDAKGTKLYVADLDNRRIRAIDMASGIVSLIAGNGKAGKPKDGADAKEAPLVDPRACAVDSKGNVYILERGGNALRVVDSERKIRTVAGTGARGLSGDGGAAIDAKLDGPKHLCVDGADDVYLADTGNHVIRKYTPRDGKIVRIAGTGKKGPSEKTSNPLTATFNEPHGVTLRGDGTLFIVDSFNHRVFRLAK